MNSDSAFFIGKEHLICQDYGLSGQSNDITYAFLSDGCSSSTNVDVGARMLCLSAQNIIRRVNPDDCHTQVELFGNAVINLALQTYNVFPDLNLSALEATLLGMWVYNNKATIVMFGDGLFVRKRKDVLDYVFIQLSNGAPDYLVYQISPSRKTSYEKMDGQKIIQSSEGLIVSEPKLLEPIILQFDVEEGDILALTSDGIDTFFKNDEKIPWMEMTNQLLDFKSTVGVFVQRKINFFLRKSQKENIFHSDDLTLSVIHC